MFSKLALLCCLALQVLLTVALLARCSAANPIGEPSKQYRDWNANQTQLENHGRFKRDINGNVNLDFDVNDFIRSIERWVRHAKPGERRGFVKALREKASHKAPRGYHVMVFNMNQEYDSRISGQIAYTPVNEYESHFGIWVFKCGTFMNKGDRGWENWAYTMFDHDKNFANGNGVLFKHPECENPAYRPFNHHIIYGKDYPGSDIRTFYNVETRDECMAWTIEIDANVAVYREDIRECYAKETHYGRGITYDTSGNRLGDYDVNAFDIEEANGHRKQDWIRGGKCNVIHSNIPPDDRHYCKVFNQNQACTLMFRRRD